MMDQAVRYAIGAAVIGLAAASASVTPSSDVPNAALGTVSSEARIRDMDIEFYQRRVERDPRSAGDYTRLAGLYLQRGRDMADNTDLLRAEQKARHSIQLRTGHNAAGFGVLASSLVAQHRFMEALQVAQRLLALDSTSIAARGLLGEIQLELGRYEEAGRTLGMLATYHGDLSVAPRLARWHELHGDPEQARRLLRLARDDARRRHGTPKEQLAWFQLRLGDLALRNGHLGEAEGELRDGLRLLPGDPRLLGTMARLEAARHRWRAAIEYGERTIGYLLDPATLGVVGDAYAAAGDGAKAEEYYKTMEVTVLHQPGPFHRAWSLFLLDHGRDLPRVLSKVQEELQTRRDIYGYDLLAWALYKSGRHRDAHAAMTHALSLGTGDAILFYHAGMIERALGDNAAAGRHLEMALAANPYWHPLQPSQARLVLDSIAARR
jgi:tetratricopeptide (TPR) repeat protein